MTTQAEPTLDAMDVKTCPQIDLRRHRRYLCMDGGILRLAVRPGITGWAQVNGGVLLSATEKDALDVWYIRKASLLLDLRIVGRTFLSLVKHDRRSEEAVLQAMLSYAHLQGSNQTLWSASAASGATHLNEVGVQAN